MYTGITQALSLSLSLSRRAGCKQSIVLILLPSLIQFFFVRSFIRSLFLFACLRQTLLLYLSNPQTHTHIHTHTHTDTRPYRQTPVRPTSAATPKGGNYYPSLTQHKWTNEPTTIGQRRTKCPYNNTATNAFNCQSRLAQRHRV